MLAAMGLRDSQQRFWAGCYEAYVAATSKLLQERQGILARLQVRACRKSAPRLRARQPACRFMAMHALTPGMAPGPAGHPGWVRVGGAAGPAGQLGAQSAHHQQRCFICQQR